MAGRTYEFILRGANGRYDQSAKIVLPSVTTIASAVLAKPQLAPWYYSTTVDVISAGITALYNSPEGIGIAELMDTFSDHELLDEWIRESQVHPDDVADDASERGQVAHNFLHSLALMHKTASPADALRLAEKALNDGKTDPWRLAVAKAWLAERFVPIETERVVYSLRHRYAGRLDLRDEQGVVDLKTRRADLGIYTSDQVQLDGYKIAVEETEGISIGRGRVLLAKDNGEYSLEEAWVPDGSFIKIVELYYMLRKTAVK